MLAAALMAKLVSSYEKKRIQLSYGVITAYLFVVELVGIYKGK